MIYLTRIALDPLPFTTLSLIQLSTEEYSRFLGTNFLSPSRPKLNQGNDW